MEKTATPISEQSTLKIKNTNTPQGTNIPSRETDYEKAFEKKTGKKFNVFYKMYYPKLVWLIRKINIDQLDAEDIANQAFMKSLEKIEMYNPQWHFSTWLFDIGKNMAYQYKKQSARTICVESISEDSEVDIDFGSQSGLKFYINAITKVDDSDEKSQYDRVSDRKYKLTLKAISGLKDKYKTVINLCDIQGKSYTEITEITGLPMQTVKNRLHHGRLKLEEELKSKFNWINEHMD